MEGRINSIHGPTNPRKILTAGDSLLHRLKQHKMKVGDIETLKLSQRGDNLDGTFRRTHNFISRRTDTNFSIVVQACTKDLNKSSVSPQSCISKLKEHVNEIKSFSNVPKIFLCKVPPHLSSFKCGFLNIFSRQNLLLVTPIVSATVEQKWREKMSGKPHSIRLLR